MKRILFQAFIVCQLIFPSIAQNKVVLNQKQSDSATGLTENDFVAKAQQKCPTITLFRQSNDSVNNVWVYSVRVENAEPKLKLNYKWIYLRDGKKSKIKAGQGTSTITIDNVNLDLGIYVRVEVRGLPKGCSNKAEESHII